VSTCEACGAVLHETDNILGRFCDPDCAEKGDECQRCGLVPHRCRCEPCAFCNGGEFVVFGACPECGEGYDGSQVA
jgi:hypothetical protein